MCLGTGQEYMILQEVTTFEYPATLCSIRRSQDYYDCVWRLHIRITAPAMVHQRETVPVRECAIMDLTGIFQDPLSRVEHRLNSSVKVNHFKATVIGSLTYKGGYFHYVREDCCT